MSWVCDYILTPKCRRSSALQFRYLKESMFPIVFSWGYPAFVFLEVGLRHRNLARANYCYSLFKWHNDMLHWNSGIEWPRALQVKRGHSFLFAWKVFNGQRSAESCLSCLEWITMKEGGDGQRQAGRQIIRWMSRHRAESYQQGTTGKQTILDHHVLVSLLDPQGRMLIKAFVLHSQCDKTVH